MKCTHQKTWENVHQIHRMNTQWLHSVVLRMKCTVGQQQQLTVMGNGHVKWTGSHFYISNIMFLITNSYMYFHFPDFTYIPSEYMNWISLYTQWRAGSKLLQNTITIVHGIISQRTGIFTSTTPNLSTYKGNTSFHTIIVL